MAAALTDDTYQQINFQEWLVPLTVENLSRKQVDASTSSLTFRPR